VDDWYTVTLADLKAIGLPSRMNRKQLSQLLQEKYPQHNWQELVLLRAKFAQQKRLERIVQDIFPVRECILLPFSNPQCIVE
jgi:ribosomal protein S3AE